MVEFWSNWVDKYPIISIEDGMAEDDWDAWKKLTDAVGDKGNWWEMICLLPTQAIVSWY